MVSIPFLSNSTNQEAPAVDVRDPNEEQPQRGHKPLDIVFLQDTTGSQGPYIKAARQAIRDICDKISASAQFPKDSELIRFGLIAFRDHPPQDSTYVTKEFGFTSDIKVMQKNLTGLVATGGGDGPEAQTAALAAALNLEWKDDAIKVVILITDAPPHGLGELGDGFDKSPDQNDPLDMARQMAERGITLFVVACEPTLSTAYMHALDFYSALVQITSGRLLPLLMAEKLGDYIVASAIETIETEQLISEFEHVIIDDVYAKSKPIEDVMAEVHQKLQNRGTQLQTMELENVYNEDEQATKNRELWFGAISIGEARSKVLPVGTLRLKPEFAAASMQFEADPPLHHVYKTRTHLSTDGGPVRRTKRSEPDTTPMRGRGRARGMKRSPRAGDASESSPIYRMDTPDGVGDASGSMLHMQMLARSSAATYGMKWVPPVPQGSGMMPMAQQQQQQLARPQQQMQQMQQAAPQQQMQQAMKQQQQLMASRLVQQGQQGMIGQQMQQQQQQQPKMTLERTNFSMSQAHRLVMQSLTRNSKVTATGLTSKTGETAGQQVSIGPYKEM